MIYKAVQFAIKAHADQKRKLDGDLYVAHPLEVGVILAKEGLSDSVIAAGILHDTLEDTATTLDKIAMHFNAEVADLVNFCTEQDKTLSWQERKERYIKHLAEAPLNVLYIVASDKLSNLSSLSRSLKKHGYIDWSQFNADYASQHWYYQMILKSLQPIAHSNTYQLLQIEMQNVFSMRP